MEYGSIEREIYVDASPEVVFEVISSPKHLREWWPDEADIEPTPGAVGEVATPTNSLLVIFELVPSGAGTTVRLTETGFREKGWEVAVLEQQYKEHVVGWDTHLPRLVDYVTRLVPADDRCHRRRPLVGDRGPDPATDARPAAGGR